MGAVRKMKRMALALVAVLSLVAGILAVSAEENTAAMMKLRKTEGTVGIANGNGRALSVREDMALYSGYRAGTEAESYAWISLDNAKLVKMDEASGASIRKNGKRLEILLESGNLFFNVAEPLEDDETMYIRTSGMIIGIRGTCGWVEVADIRHARVCILEGSVEVEATDPVTGEVKKDTISGGETAVCVAYEKNDEKSGGGTRCDILRGRLGAEDIRGFVLTDLLQDRALIGKIHKDSGIDLRGMTAEEAVARQEADEEAVRGVLEEAGKNQKIQARASVTAPEWTGKKTPGEEGVEPEVPGSSGAQDQGGQASEPEPWQTYAPAPSQTYAPAPSQTYAPAPWQTSAPAPWQTYAPGPWQTSAPAPWQTYAPGPWQTSAPAPGQSSAPVQTSTPAPVQSSTPVPGESSTPAPVYTVTFDTNGGTVSGETTVEREPGAALGTLPVPLRSRDADMPSDGGYEFSGWYTDGGELVGGATPVSGDMSLHARWMKWVYDAKTKTLTVSSDGYMPSYSNAEPAPWNGLKDQMKAVVLGDGIMSIGTVAFYGCSRLTSVIIPASVTSIGNFAFGYCSGLTSVRIPAGVTSIENNVFYGCSGLTSVRIPAGVTSIGDSAFNGCRSLTSVTISDSVTSIGAEAFSGCSGLTSVTIPDSVTSIGNSAFSSCSGLTRVTIPTSVTSIGDSAFDSCTNLTTVNYAGTEAEWKNVSGYGQISSDKMHYGPPAS